MDRARVTIVKHTHAPIMYATGSCWTLRGNCAKVKNSLPIITGTSVMVIVLRMRSIHDKQHSTSTLAKQYVGMTLGARFFSS